MNEQVRPAIRAVAQLPAPPSPPTLYRACALSSTRAAACGHLRRHAPAPGARGRAGEDDDAGGHQDGRQAVPRAPEPRQPRRAQPPRPQVRAAPPPTTRCGPFGRRRDAPKAAAAVASAPAATATATITSPLLHRSHACQWRAGGADRPHISAGRAARTAPGCRRGHGARAFASVCMRGAAGGGS